MADTRLELSDESRGESRDRGAVPPPLPPADPEAWYAPEVQAQYEAHPGVVVTISRPETDFAYDVREPQLTARDEADLERVEAHFADAHIERLRTQEGSL